jgi:tRNA nucleotidyltransferase (CCA-adding enzyme)
VAAVRAGALQTVSPQRLGQELRLALSEPDPPAVLHAAQNLGIVSGLRLDPRVIVDALALLPVGARSDLTLLGAAGADASWADTYALTAQETRVLARCAALVPVMPDRPSEVVRALRGEPVEAVAVAGARGDAETAGLYLHRWRHVALEIDGGDLLVAGVPEGPEVGERLARVLALRLDGELPSGRTAELEAALR